MIWIKDGRFTMGSSSSEKGRDKDEGTQHSVTISGFYLSRNEITQGQYRTFDDDHQSYFKGDNRPVEDVTWLDATRFCNWLSEQEGLTAFYDEHDLSQASPHVAMNWEADGYRLPTEAEWEYACRAGKPSPFYTGHCITTEQANYNGEHPYRMCTIGVYRQEPWNVGSGSPNAFDLSDMHGNILEWCNDWYGAYPRESATNPAGPVSGTERVARGGSWYGGASACRSAEREAFSPDYAVNYLGFRVARPR
jgi:formylglycine-generating enzyme required for sulfatase activity